MLLPAAPQEQYLTTITSGFSNFIASTSYIELFGSGQSRINIIFSGRYFYSKGGLHALEAIDQLTKKYPNVYGVINSDIPEKVLKEYSKNKKIEFHGLIPQNELFELYKKFSSLLIELAVKIHQILDC